MARTDNPNYGPGSISTIAKGRKAAIQADIAKNTPKKTSLLNAITQASEGPMTQSSSAIQERIRQKKATAADTGQTR